MSEDDYKQLVERALQNTANLMIATDTGIEAAQKVGELAAREEIEWAKAAGAIMLPVWHNGFVYRSSDWNLPPEIDHILGTTHTIRVLEESALAYNNALVELLNRFGITP